MIKEKSSAISLIQELLSAKKELISAKKIMDKKDKHIYPISNVPFKIPYTWQWVFLSDISIIQEGPGIRKHQYQDSGIQFLTVTNILEGSVDLFKSQKYISIDEYNEKYKHYTINKGDIVTACSGATWGKSAIYENEDILMLNTSTLRLRFFNDLGDNKFLYFLTKSNYFKSNLASHSTGQQPNYGYSHYSKIPIPIPPIEEQKRIVDLLNEVLYKIDQAKANIEKNIENAKELFQSKLNDIFSQKGDGWEEKKIEEVSKVVNGYSFKSKDFSAENEIKSIKITNVGIMEFVEDLSNNLPNSFLNVYSKVRVNKGDLVLALTRTIISGGLKVARVPESYHNSLLNQRVAAIVANADLVDGDYLYYYFSSNIVYNYVLDNVNTLMQPNLSIGDLKKMPVPITSIKRQKEISQQIENLSESNNMLISNYNKKFKNLEELKKSILQKAFAGKLTEELIMDN